MPWLLLALGAAAAALSLRPGSGVPPAAARWSALLGIALVLGVWAFHSWT